MIQCNLDGHDGLDFIDLPVVPHLNERVLIGDRKYRVHSVLYTADSRKISIGLEAITDGSSYEVYATLSTST